MEIPKNIRRDGRKYKFVKKYPNYYMYQDVETGVKECFQAFDLGLIEKNKESVKQPKKILRAM